MGNAGGRVVPPGRTGGSPFGLGVGNKRAGAAFPFSEVSRSAGVCVVVYGQVSVGNAICIVSLGVHTSRSRAVPCSCAKTIAYWVTVPDSFTPGRGIAIRVCAVEGDSAGEVARAGLWGMVSMGVW